jgi:hypothetical protein
LTSLQESLGKADKTTEGEEGRVERETGGGILLCAATTAAAGRARTVASLLSSLVVERDALELALDLAVATLARGSKSLELVARRLDIGPARDVERTLDIVERGELGPNDVSNSSK